MRVIHFNEEYMDQAPNSYAPQDPLKLIHDNFSKTLTSQENEYKLFNLLFENMYEEKGLLHREAKIVSLHSPKEAKIVSMSQPQGLKSA